MIERIYNNFSGGVNKQVGPIIQDGGDAQALLFAEDAYNWEMSERGLLKYPGFLSVIDTPDAGTVTGIFTYLNANTGLLERVVCKGEKIYLVTGNSETEIYSGVTEGAYFQSITWDDGAGTEILILMNGVDKPLYYDGTQVDEVTFTDDTNPIWNDARPKGAAVFRGRILYWGDPTHPHRIYTPKPGTFDNFDNTEEDVDAFDVDAGYGGIITGVRALTDNFLVIYKERAIRRLQGIGPFGSESPEDFQLREVTDSFGCIAPRTLVGNDVEHYFLSEDGLRQLKPIESYGDIDPQQPTFAIQPIINGLNWSGDAIKNACAVIDRAEKQLWLAVPEGISNENNRVIIFDLISRGNDLRRTGDFPVSSFAFLDRKVYHGGYDGQLYQHTGASYDGQTMEAMWESKWIAHFGVGRLKVFRKLIFYADSNSSGDIIIQWQVMKRGQASAFSATQKILPSGGTWNVDNWNEMLWSSGTQGVLEIKNLGKGQAIKLRLVNLSATQQPRIRQVEMYFDPLGVVKG